MNLLFLTYQGGVAGSTNSISYLTKGLAEKGHQVYMGCRKESRLYSMLENSPVHLIPMEFKGKLDRQNIRHIRDVVRKYNIQIINAQSSIDRYTSIFAKWWYRLPVKIVHTRRQTPESIGGWLQNSFYVKGTDKIVVVSDSLKEVFVGIGLPAEHLEVIYNGIPRERFEQHQAARTEELRRQYGFTPSDKVIGFVSRFKKQDQLIAALAFLPEDLKVMFVGIDKSRLDPFIQQHSIKQEIICTGSVPMEDVINYYPLFDINVLASTTDGFGLVLVEAMGMGVPVVGTRAPGICNVIEDGESGLLFEDNNPQDLAQKISLIIQDQELKSKLTRNGLQRAQQTFSVVNTVNNYEAFFRSLLENETSHKQK